MLLLGGTTEAAALAEAMAAAGIAGLFSYAGRTAAPAPQPLPMRVGGFGGVAGLATFLGAEDISHVVDATHPFAARMSGNAVGACAIAGVPLIALERPAWAQAHGDQWIRVADTAAAVTALPMAKASVFLAIGRQEIAAFSARPEHHYLLRVVDPPTSPLPLPEATVTVTRGPFGLDGDLALMRAHGIDLVVAKNAGGVGARAKIDAARMLGLPVILIERPPVPDRHVVHSVKDAMRWLHGADRGV